METTRDKYSKNEQQNNSLRYRLVQSGLGSTWSLEECIVVVIVVLISSDRRDRSSASRESRKRGRRSRCARANRCWPREGRRGRGRLADHRGRYERGRDNATTHDKKRDCLLLSWRDFFDDFFFLTNGLRSCISFGICGDTSRGQHPSPATG